MNTSSAAVRIGGPQDVLTLIPYLLGFHPHDSVVVIACRDGRVELTARFDLALCQDPPQLRCRLAHLCADERRFILVAYTDDVARANEALHRVGRVLGPSQVLVALRTDERRVWTRGRPGSQPVAPRAMLAQTLRDHLTAPLHDRDHLTARVAGPPASAMPTASLLCADALARIAALDATERCRTASQLAIRGRLAPDDLTDTDAALLAGLMGDGAVRDVVWSQMTRDNAAEFVRLWLRVLDVCCPSLCVPVLGLAGMAAWASGEGALMVCCLERGLSLDAADPLVQLLEGISVSCLPPSAWDTVAATLAADEPVPVG